MRGIIAISLIGSIAIGLLGGCGSGEDKIDKASFVEQANEICERVSGRLAAEFTTTTQRESQKPNYDFVATQVAVVKDSLIPALEEQQKEIRALGLPEDAEKETEALLSAYQRSIVKIEANPKAAATAATPPYEAIELAGTRFGVTECPIAPVTPN